MVGGGGQGKEKSSSSEVVGLMKNRGLVIFAERLKEEIFELPLKRLERRTLHLVLEGREGVARSGILFKEFTICHISNDGSEEYCAGHL